MRFTFCTQEAEWVCLIRVPASCVKISRQFLGQPHRPLGRRPLEFQNNFSHSEMAWETEPPRMCPLEHVSCHYRMTKLKLRKVEKQHSHFH